MRWKSSFFHNLLVMNYLFCKSADLQDFILCFLLFQVLRFLCLCKESSKESTRRRGEKNLPALRSTPLRAEGFLFRAIPRRASPSICLASNEMFRSGNLGSVSDEMRCSYSINIRRSRIPSLSTVHCPLSTFQCPLSVKILISCNKKNRRFAPAFFYKLIISPSGGAAKARCRRPRGGSPRQDRRDSACAKEGNPQAIPSSRRRISRPHSTICSIPR